MQLNLKNIYAYQQKSTQKLVKFTDEASSQIDLSFYRLKFFSTLQEKGTFLRVFSEYVLTEYIPRVETTLDSFIAMLASLYLLPLLSEEAGTQTFTMTESQAHLLSCCEMYHRLGSLENTNLPSYSSEAQMLEVHMRQHRDAPSEVCEGHSSP